MNLQKSIWIYCFISFAFLVSEMFEISILSNVLSLLLIPFVGYSLFKFREKTQTLLVIAMTLCFVSDVCNIFPYSKSLKYIFIFSGLSYLVFSRICFKLIFDYKVKRLMFSSTPLLIVWFLYYNYCARDIFGEALGNLYSIAILYSVSIGLFLILSIVCYYNNDNRITLYTVLMALSFLIGDTLMGMNIYFTPSRYYEIFNGVFQISAYYFIYMFGLRNVEVTL